MGAWLTASVLSTIVAQQKKITDSDFEHRVDDAAEHLETAIQKYSNLVLATQALFHASENVSRAEFKTFIDSYDIKEKFPYAQALSWNAALASDNTEAFERSVRLDDSIQAGGYPEFKVHPETEEDMRYVVTYIEPMQGNEGAFGFDIGSNADRRATVELARDTGRVVATAPITLAQESGSQKGFLMMLPVIETSSQTGLPDERKKFSGVVVAVFRIGDLISTSSDLSFTSLRVLDVTDFETSETSQPIFSHGDKLTAADHLQFIRKVSVADRQWEMIFTRPSSTSVNTASNWAIGVLGLLVTALSAIFVGYILTTRRRIHQQAQLLTADLQDANKELSRSNEDLAQYAYIASHDLQSPIRNVRMSVELLEEELGDAVNAEVRQYLNILHKSAEKMSMLVSDLLEYAKSGNDGMHLTEVDLNTVFASVESELLELCKQRNVSLLIKDMPTIQANERELERVFVNLIENAIRYSRADIPPIVEIDALRLGDTLKIFIKDNGIGIDRQFHESVFAPFRRLHRHEQIKGTGLGLAICRKTIERHGGTISVDSSSESGTVFLVTLPMS